MNLNLNFIMTLISQFPQYCLEKETQKVPFSEVLSWILKWMAFNVVFNNLQYFTYLSKIYLIHLTTTTPNSCGGCKDSPLADAEPERIFRKFLLCHAAKHTFVLKTKKVRENWASLAWMPLVPLLPLAHRHWVKAINPYVAAVTIKWKQWAISHPLWGFPSLPHNKNKQLSSTSLAWVPFLLYPCLLLDSCSFCLLLQNCRGCPALLFMPWDTWRLFNVWPGKKK